MQGETGKPHIHTPLPPVTTRWRSPESRLDDSSSQLAPPYVRGSETSQRRINPAPTLSAQPIHDAGLTRSLDEPVLRMFDSEPIEAAEERRLLDEPMPWEEYQLLSRQAGPALTSEADVADVAAQDAGDSAALEDWASAIDPDRGEAVPAYGDEASVEAAAFAPPPRLDIEGGVIPEPVVPDRVFPLDAFIIPPDSKRLPKGLEHAEVLQFEIAEELAFRLDAMADRLRTEGFTGLLVLDERHRPVDTLLAGVLAGYLAHETEELEAEGPQ